MGPPPQLNDLHLLQPLTPPGWNNRKLIRVGLLPRTGELLFSHFQPKNADNLHPVMTQTLHKEQTLQFASSYSKVSASLQLISLFGSSAVWPSW